MTALQVVIPMAGLGSRFADAGFSAPKPFIEVFPETWMIELVLANLMPRDRSAHLILVCQRQHLSSYDVTGRLGRFGARTDIVALDGVTDGAARTVMAAAGRLDPASPMMIANSDQWLNHSSDTYLAAVAASPADGVIMTMRADDPKWSFVARDDAGQVCRVVEKEVVSNEATVGVYNFKRAGDFIAAARAMFGANDRVNGEFYVAPTYTYMIRAGSEIDTFDAGDVGNTMWGLGTPEDLALFLESSFAATAKAQLAEWGS